MRILVSHLIPVCLLIASLAACSQGSDGSSGTDGATGGSDANVGTGGTTGSGGTETIGTTGAGGASTGSTTGAGSTTGPLNPLPPTYNASTYVFPEPTDSANCTAATNATSVIEHVAFAQTHVMEPGWPFFYLVSERPAFVEVVVTGSGAAPDVLLQASVNGQQVGKLCLKGPATLPATVDWTKHSKSDRYTVTLPSAWLMPGLSVKVTAGTASKTFSIAQLGVMTVPDVNLIMLTIDPLNYNTGATDTPVPNSFLADFASAVPSSHVRLGRFPARVVLPKIVTSHGTSDGSGVAPEVVSLRLCRSNETPGTTCAKPDVDGMELLGSVQRYLASIHQATGEFSYAFYFGNTGQFGSGGWGGGKNFVGADFTDIFIHEQGHSFSLLHWGEGAYQNTNPGASDYRYPYGGITSDGGGRGDTWNFDQNVGEYVSNVCQDPKSSIFGKERSDAMQRKHPCIGWRSTGAGPWDGYGDFSALSILRNLRGATEASGTVSYGGVSAPYHLPSMDGYPNLVIDGSGKRSLVRQSGNAIAEEKHDFLVPQVWNAPVATIFGTYHPGPYPDVNILYAPLVYQGTLPRVLDPTDPTTFDLLASDPYEGYFYWPKDLSLKITYADGSHIVALVTQQGPKRDWTLGQGPWRFDMVYFAVNVPADKAITRVDLYHRPFCVRYANSPDAGNIVNKSLDITAANFLDEATLVTSWTP